MTEGPLTPQLEAQLVARHCNDLFSAEGFARLLACLRHVEIAPHEVLLRQGDAGDDLYLIVAGRVTVAVTNAAGASIRVDEVGPGGVVGEMALLTGHPRTATVQAVERCNLARLSRADFERLGTEFPETLNEFLRRILPRLRQTQLVSLLTELFGKLQPDALHDLEEHFEWVRVASGERLFHAGEAGAHVFVVLNGRLRVVTAESDGRERVLEEVGRGGTVGEIAMLTGEPRAATVYAVRDSHLLRLSTAAFDALLERHPQAMMQIARAAVARLRHTARVPAYRGNRPVTFAVIPAADVPVAEFAGRLTATLSGLTDALRLSASEVDRLLAKPGIAQSREDSLVHEPLTAWLSTQEREHEALVLEADATWTPWTRRCVAQADRVLVVGRAGGDPMPGPVEREIADLGLAMRSELVLIQSEATTQPSGTLAWLTARNVAAHHHVRLGNDADLRRLARRISGRALGLVLGGGGARGFAHIGALRALDEFGVEIDLVGGSSIGSLIAAGRAVGITHDEIMRLAETFASPKKLLDRTLPIVALMTGRKVTDLYRLVFGELQIEDLWLPLFCVSSGLSRAATVVHQRGPLWRAVRASTAIPAIFPPLLGDDNEVHVDGGVMNNMPLDVMRGLCEGGTVIGVNPMPTHDRQKDYHFGPSLSGWQALRGRLKLFGSRIRAPSILGSVMRATEINSANRMRQPAFRALADVLIEPPVESYPILAFDQYAPIIDIGYRSAKEKIVSWKAATEGARAA